MWMFDLLPPNATAQERAITLAIARDVPVPVRDVCNADKCQADLLPWLAWAFSVDEWDASWSDAQKRAVIKNSAEIHRHKGTIGAVKEALSAIGVQAEVQEWFNQMPEGEPYTFKVMLGSSSDGVAQSALKKLFSVINSAKNLRSHMDKVQVVAKTQTGPAVAAVTGLGSNIRVTNFQWATTVFNETTICM